jgi:putative DNA primase/helicase
MIGITNGAIALATRRPVFACDWQKRPVTARGFKDASRDPATIRQQFARPGAALIGVPSGEEAGFFVVDIDCKNGAPGLDWVHENRHRLPNTRQHRTRSGGAHLLYQWPSGRTIRNSAGKLAPGVDVRGDGGFVIVPPSPGYSLDVAAPMAAAPAWLLDAIDPPRQPAPPPMAPRRHDGSGTRFALAALDAETRAILEAPDGGKHHAVNRAGFSIAGLVAAGELPEAEARAALRSALAGIASRCRDFGAAEATLNRAWQAGLAKPRQPSGSARP